MGRELYGLTAQDRKTYCGSGKASIRFGNRPDDIGGWFSTLPARLLDFLHPGSCTMQPPVRNLTPARRSNDVAWAAICAQLWKVVVRRWDVGA